VSAQPIVQGGMCRVSYRRAAAWQWFRRGGVFGMEDYIKQNAAEKNTFTQRQGKVKCTIPGRGEEGKVNYFHL